MRDLFPGWVPPDEETLDRYWSEATFAVDTSVLLDLYRFSEEARDGLLKALRSFEERLWIPHQVALEFHRNRLGVLLDQREAENNLLQELNRIRQDLDSQLSQLLRGAGRRDLAPLREAIDGGFDSLKKKLKEAEEEHTKGLGESIRDDPIYEEVVELCAGRVGPPFDEEKQAAVTKDAEERFRTKTPPGYMDEGKDNETKYGDVVLWHQLCQRASETHRPVVLVADDQKADWVWEVRGKTIGPRPELVAEMSEQAGVGFHLYTPTRFLQVWEQREEGREVEPEVLAELEASSEDAPRPKEPTLLARLVKAVLEGQADSNFLQVKASHVLEENQVSLSLAFLAIAQSESPPLVVATVRSPQALEARVPTYPISSTPTPIGQRFSYSLRYPEQFGQHDLPAGEYEVLWEVVDPEKRHSITHPLARHPFTVTAGA